jgi:hypothetical protein
MRDRTLTMLKLGPGVGGCHVLQFSRRRVEPNAESNSIRWLRPDLADDLLR